MLEGFVPFPPEFAKRYRDKGYWRDQSLAQEFDVVFKRFGKSTALIDGERSLQLRDHGLDVDGLVRSAREQLGALTASARASRVS